MRDAFIIDAVRTPRSRRKGRFSKVHPVDLLARPLQALTQRQELEPKDVADVVVGCVTQTGEQGWCVGRKGVLAAGWPITIPATTVNRLCGSGQQALNAVAAGVMAGAYDIAVAGGVEHMTRCAMFSDISGEESTLLTTRFPDLVPQGLAAEILSREFRINREDADRYAAESQKRAVTAAKEGRFAKSLIAVPYIDENGAEQQLTADDTPRPDTTPEKLGTLQPVFQADGIITAGNASAIVDGAAAILVCSERAAQERKLTPRARIVTFVSVGSPPKIMLTGPISASRLALERAGLSIDDIDIWEINEAFAPVPLVTIHELGLNPAKVNVNGGGISLGHPLGATGAMLIGTALDELERQEKRYALVTMCIGLGMGIATIIERV